MPLPSPTITRAVKLNRRPPLTTLDTRLIATTRSRNWLFSPPSRPPPRPPRSSRRPRPSRSPPPPPRGGRLSVVAGPALPAVIGCSDIMQSFRFQSLEFQPALARGIRQRSDPAAVGVAAPIEDHGVDARGLGALGDQLADPNAVGLLVAVDRTHVRLDGRRRG